MEFRVGSVPYLNAKPLVRWFQDLGQASPVDVVYDVPARLPALLQDGEAQAILVSSIESLRYPQLSIAQDVGICSQGDVLSVRVFSKVPFDQIGSLALDASSMTSNGLAQIILDRLFGVQPTLGTREPDLETMLIDYDAAVLIGDNGMRADGRGLEVLDLGGAWRNLTGLPFVWALWVGTDALEGRLGMLLHEAKVYGQRHLTEIIRDAPAETGLSESLCDRYLREVMTYDIGPREQAGLERFREELARLSLLPDPAFA